MTTVWILLIATMSYPLLRGYQLRRSRELRLEFADAGKAILANPRFDKRQKAFFSALLDDAFEWKYMAFAAILLPIITARLLVDASFRRRVLSEQPELDGIQKTEEGKKFLRLHWKVVAAANPLCAFIVMLEVLFLLVPTAAIIAGIQAARNAAGRGLRELQKEVTEKVGSSDLTNGYNHA